MDSFNLIQENLDVFQKKFPKSLYVAPRDLLNASAVGVPQASRTIVLGKDPPCCPSGSVQSRGAAAPSCLYSSFNVLLVPGLQGNVSFWPSWAISWHFKSLPCHVSQKTDEKFSLFTWLPLAGGRALVPLFALRLNIFFYYRLQPNFQSQWNLQTMLSNVPQHRLAKSFLYKTGAYINFHLRFIKELAEQIPSFLLQTKLEIHSNVLMLNVMFILNKTLNVEIILNQLCQHPRGQAWNGANRGCRNTK